MCCFTATQFLNSVTAQCLLNINLSKKQTLCLIDHNSVVTLSLAVNLVSVETLLIPLLMSHW